MRADLKKIGEEKLVIIISIILSLLVYAIGIIVSLPSGITGYDYNFYYNAVKTFWEGGDPYSLLYFYVSYSFILFAWMYFLPYIVGLFVHIAITEVMFLWILINLKKNYHYGWYFGNVIVIIVAFITLNIDIWCAFGLFMYNKYREKWYSPFFLIFSFLKLTAVLVAGVIFLINIIFEKKVRWKQIPAFTVVLGIVFVSLLFGSGLLGNIRTNALVLQMPHLIWYSLIIMVFTQFQDYSDKTLGGIWVVYAVCQLMYGITWSYIWIW